jgi:hypothetical protein
MWKLGIGRPLSLSEHIGAAYRSNAMPHGIIGERRGACRTDGQRHTAGRELLNTSAFFGGVGTSLPHKMR